MSRLKSGRVTLSDIALQCGYTANTVSRALKDDKKLPAQTRVNIQTIAREMGYVPNLSACTLRSGSSHTVAVIANNITNPYFTNILAEVDQYLKKKNYHMVILCTHLDERLAEQMIQIAISQSVDGILFFPFSNPDHVHHLKNSGIPFVLLDRWVAGAEGDVTRLDDQKGGYLLARHLLERGHRKLLYIAGPFVNSSQIDRQSGILRAFGEMGVSEENLRVIPYDRCPSRPQPGEMLPLLTPIDYTAVIAYNDVLAYHCMNELRSIGARIPEDISLVGFDNIRRNNSYLPQLTSITVDGDSVAKIAVAMLFDRIDQPGLPYRETVLPVRIHDDGTTRYI